VSGPLVIKIGGAGVDRPQEAGALWRAIAEAHRILEGQLVLVHGGGRAVDQHLERLNFRTERLAGLRVTPPEQMDEIAGVLAGRVNKALVGTIQAAGRAAVGLCLGDGLAFRSVPHAVAALGRVGEVSGGDGKLLQSLMSEGYLPVLCSIGLDDRGGFLNVNADDAAAGVARVLNARALVLLTDVEGIRDAAGERISTIDEAGIESLIESGVISGGMIPKARAAASGAARAGSPAYIASFNQPDAVVRLARGEPVGTQVLPPAVARAHGHAG
jgi:acetylglutamate kinase